MNEERTIDLDFVKRILPDHYNLLENERWIRCRSTTGISHKLDSDDDEHWEYIVKAIEQHFGERLQEIYHNTNYCHVDFVIYFKN